MSKDSVLGSDFGTSRHPGAEAGLQYFIYSVYLRAAFLAIVELPKELPGRLLSCFTVILVNLEFDLNAER